MCFVKYLQNFYENRCNSNAPVFFQNARCIHFCMEWTPLMHIWFLLTTSIENVGKQKENVYYCVIHATKKHDVISAHILYSERT